MAFRYLVPIIWIYFPQVDSINDQIRSDPSPVSVGIQFCILGTWSGLFLVSYGTRTHLRRSLTTHVTQQVFGNSSKTQAIKVREELRMNHTYPNFLEYSSRLLNRIFWEEETQDAHRSSLTAQHFGNSRSGLTNWNDCWTCYKWS